MQGSFWKTVAVVGVIGIGGLAILEVQKRLDQRNAQLAPEDAEALAAKILASSEESVKAPITDSEFDQLMADTQSGQFALSPPNAGTPGATQTALLNSEPTGAQRNTPPVDTTVHSEQLALGGNPFEELAGSSTVAANYQTDSTTAGVAPVAFTEEQTGSTAADTEQPQPFRRDGIVQEQPEQSKPEENFPFFKDDSAETALESATPKATDAAAPAANALVAAPETTDTAGIQFFPGTEQETSSPAPEQTAQFYGQPDGESATLSDTQPEQFQNAPLFDGSPDTNQPEPSFVPFREEPVAADNPPVLKSTPNAGSLFTEDSVPLPTEPQFDNSRSPVTEPPNFGEPAEQPETTSPDVRDQGSLPFVEDVPPTSVPPLNSDNPTLSIPLPENSVVPQPQPDRTFTLPEQPLSNSAPADEQPVRTLPELNSLPDRENSTSPFREDIQPGTGEVREFGSGLREFNGSSGGISEERLRTDDSIREFNGGVREFQTSPREFSPEPMNMDIRSRQDNSRNDVGGSDLRTDFDSSPPRDFHSNRRRTDIRQVSGVMRPNLVLEKEAPENATVGTPLDYNIYVSNEGDATAYEVVVEDEVPAGARVEGASPVASRNRQTNKLIWEFEEIQPRETKKITVRVTPTGEGMLDGVATVKFKARVKATTVITAPKLRLQMVGPDEVRLGEEVSYRYVITNEGSGEARDVYVRTVLPVNGGLKHPAGQDLEYEITSLKPAEQREIVLAVVAAEPGEYRTQAEVTAAGGARDQAMWKTNIVGAQLKIDRRGPKRRFVGRPGVYENIISNETNFEAVDARVIEKVPEGMRFISATKGGSYNSATRTVTWQVPRIGAGKMETLQVELMPTNAGARESVVTVFENAGIRSEDYVSTTQVEDLHNVSADISQLDGPVAIGETFGFTISIDNRGTADATDVELIVSVPPEIKVVGAGSRDIPAKLTEGNQVQYNLIVRIEPNRKQDFELKLQGAQSVRNGVVKASVRYRQMTEPLVVSESVTVYRDEL